MLTMDLHKDAFHWMVPLQVWSYRTFSPAEGSPFSTGQNIPRYFNAFILLNLSRSDSEFEISPKSMSRHSSVASNISG